MKFTFPKGNKYCVGRVPWNKGKKGIHLSPQTEFKAGRRDSNHPEWKGERASYDAVHAWVARWKGRPKKCEMCGTTESKNYDWANKDHKYRRDLNDFIRMCKKCHFAYDVKFNGKKSLVTYTKRCTK